MSIDVEAATIRDWRDRLARAVLAEESRANGVVTTAMVDGALCLVSERIPEVDALCRSAAPVLATAYLEASAGLDTIRTALGNGDEALHPVGMTLAEAVAWLAGERAAVVAWLRDEEYSRLAYAIEAGEHRSEG